MKRSIVATTVLGTAITVLVAACSSSGSTKSTTSGSAQPSSTATGTPAASGSDIKLMQIADTASPALSVPQAVTGAQAGVNTVNATGGIAGHKLVLLTCNSQGDPNKTAACGREAVADHVAAVVGAVSFQSDALNAILQQAKIPSVGSTALNKLDFTSPISFPFNDGEANELGTVVGLPDYAACRKPAVIDVNVPIFTLSADDERTFFKSQVPAAAALKIVQAQPASSSVTAEVATALAGGTDCLFLDVDPVTAIAALKAIGASGQKVRVSTTEGVVSEAALKALGSAANGVYADSDFISHGAAGGAAFTTAMNAVDPKATQDNTSEGSYTAILFLAAAAKQANLTSFTGPDLLSALNSAHNIAIPTIGTIAGYPADSGIPTLPRISQAKVFTYQWSNGAFHLLSTQPTDIAPALRIAHG